MSSQISSETPFKKLVELILNIEQHDSKQVRKDDLMSIIIRWQGLDIANAEMVFNALVKLGLGVCMYGSDYDIKKFALMRGYFNENEIKRITKADPPARKRRR